jgi:hypothetical protein
LRIKQANSQEEISSRATTQLPDAHQRIRGRALVKAHNRSEYSGYGVPRGLRLFRPARIVDPTTNSEPCCSERASQPAAVTRHLNIVASRQRKNSAHSYSDLATNGVQRDDEDKGFSKRGA